MTRAWYADLPKFYQRRIAALGLDEAGLARRRALKAMGAAGLGAAVLAGGAAPARAAATLGFMCWEGYNDPRIIEPFMQAHDCDFVFDLIVDSPGGFAKLQAGASRDIDIVASDMPWITRMGPAGLAMPLDLADYADVTPHFYEQFRPPFGPLQYEGKDFGVATRWGWVGPSLNTDFTDPKVWRSYDPVFDPQYRDKIAVMDWGDWPILPMALYAGIDPYKELDEAELEEVRKVLRAMFKNTRTLVGDLTLAQKGLLDGSLTGCIGAGSYLTSAVRKQGHKNVMAVVPEPRNGLKQGIIWVEAAAILAETDEPELTRALMKHLVSAEVGKTLSLLDTTCNFVTNAEVEATYSDEEKEVLQVADMWAAWDNSVIHEIAPNIDDMLAIWQEELVAAQ